MFFMNFTAKKKKDSFLYEGLKSGLIKVSAHGDLSWDVDKFVESSEGKEQLKKISSFLPKKKVKNK